MNFVTSVGGSVVRLGRLFVLGNSALLGSGVTRVSVAGSRKIDSASSAWLRSVVDSFHSGSVLVSGLALGADSVAHRRALQLNIPQIAVLPSGFNNITPRSHIGLARDIIASGGCLVSLLSPDCGASRSTYINRNQVIAELGSCLIVPQFNIHSGTRHTVDLARELGKPIIVRSSGASGNQFIINSPNYHTLAK